MTIEELIDKHVHAYWKTDIDPLDSTRPDQRYRDFAVELLEMMRKSGSFHSNPGMGGICTVEAINKALEELKKGTQ